MSDPLDAKHHEKMQDELTADTGFLKGLHPGVAMWSKFIVFALVVYAAIWTEQAGGVFTSVNTWILSTLKWYYIGLVAAALFLSLYLLFSPYGNIRLGKDTDRPEFSYFAWFSMLFGAGMGIGLVFWSIAEPIYHLQENPFIGGDTGIAPGSAHAGDIAMRMTFFHWGLHPWAIYVVVGMSLAYFSYRKDLPLTIRSALYPLIGERIYGPIGSAADILAIFGTIFGVATSLGLGVQQMATGIYELTGIEFFTTVNEDGTRGPAMIAMMLLIVVITSIATLSVASGLDRGVKLLSQLNLWLVIAIMVFLLAFGPTVYLLNSYLKWLGDYLSHVIPLSLWSATNADFDGWQRSWTAFYWGWWIAWAPFVGMFIARISRGRTIRGFIGGVLVVPTLLAFLWLTLFGGTALNLQLAGAADISAAVNADLTSSLYVTLDAMAAPEFLAKIAATVATILIATFFITSSDSGTLVINTVMSLGNEEPPMLHRLIWGVSEGAVAAILLLAGGLSALQTASIAAALPFSVVMVLMAIGLLRALRTEDLGAAYAAAKGHRVKGGLGRTGPR